MSALLAVVHHDVSGLLVLLLYAILAIAVLGAVYWIASMVLPHPLPVVIVLVLGVLLLLYVLAPES